MKILQINTSANTAAPGQIAENIGRILIKNNHECFIAYGRRNSFSKLNPIRIGNSLSLILHGLLTRIFDRHGYGSFFPTKRLILKIKDINPDLIHLHNLHGYYLNIRVLFKYLKKSQIPVLWTLHDCWPFTGHCSHYDYVGCYRWKSKCHSCPNKKAYPASWLFDYSTHNYFAKKELFTGLHSLRIVTPSEWLANQVKESFLKNYPVQVLPNGINLANFKPMNENYAIKARYGFTGKKIILGVASFWGRHKGFDDFIRLSTLIPEDVAILLIGLSKNQQKGLPANIVGLSRTKNLDELSAFYSIAEVFVNPTYVDTFPTTNLEALACGTPVITYNTGGSPEAIDHNTGLVVEKGDIQGLANAIAKVIGKGKNHYSHKCRERAELLFDMDKQYLGYLEIYKKMFSENHITGK